jgi:hydrogenase maturation protease
VPGLHRARGHRAEVHALSVHVICFGNAWHGDDGFGQHVLRCLPAGIPAFDAGTAGLNALGYFESCDKAVIVDAVRTGAPVGTVHRLLPRDLESPNGELSLHELGVSAVLTALREPPDVVLVGAEVSEVHAFTDRLTAPVEAAVPEAVRLVLIEVTSRRCAG